MMKLKTERGAAVVEFAVILPLLLTLFAGIVEFSLVYLNKQILTTASREGARLGIIADTTDSEIKERVKKICREEYDKGTPLIPTKFLPILATFGSAVVDLPDGNITITRSGTAFQDDLTVEVEYAYKFLLPALIGIGNTKLLRSTTVMKMEDDPTP
jgi:Flp pilus assembly protein TadG